MRIAFLLSGFENVTGIGRVVSLLANKLSENDKYGVYTISYLKTKENHYQLADEIVQLELYDETVTMKSAILTGGVSKLRNIIKSNNIDILIGCGALYFPIVVLSTIGLSYVRTIGWEHSNAKNNVEHSFQMLSRKIGAKFTDTIVTLTNHDKQIYTTKFNTDNIVQIYNPIDEKILNHQYDYDIDSKKIVSVGRFTYQKNFQILVDVAKKVLDKNPEWTWDIYGDGDEKKIVMNKIEKYGLSNKVNLKGNVNNLYKIYKKYSFLVMTSRYEGFPMVLLEGTATGLPLISFDVVTGPREIINDQVNGYLVPQLDVDIMSKKIQILIDDQNKRLYMSQKSLKTSEKFHIDVITEQWKKLFDKLLL